MMVDLKTKTGLEYLKQMKKEGKTRNDVARDNHMSGENIRRILKKYHNTRWTDLPPVSHKNRVQILIKEKGGLKYLIDMKNKGFNKNNIADELGCSVSAVDSYLHKSGVKWRDIGNKRDSRSKYTCDEEKRIIQKAQHLIGKGYTSSEISDELNMPYPQIKYIFRKHNVSFKPVKKWEQYQKEKDYCDSKKRNIKRSKRQNSTGFYRVQHRRNSYIYTCNDGVIYSENNIFDLRERVIRAGLDWIVVNPELARKTLEDCS